MQNTKSRGSVSIPTFQETMEAVSPLSALVYEVLEGAAEKSRSFFEAERQPHDPFLAPCLMRFYAKHGLRGSGIKAEEDEDVSDFEGLPNNGLAFFYKQHHARILKATVVRGNSWKLPGCGISEPKKDFYDQQLDFYADGRNAMHQSILNIVYLWDFDSHFKLAGVNLACPMSSAVYAKDVTEHWNEPIPHPAHIRPQEAPPSRDFKSEEMLENLLREQDEDGSAAKKA